jgi:hypothetical protein
MDADRAVERGAEKLHRLAEQAAAKGGVVGRLAEPLEEDAEFLRKLKPSLIKARATGAAPTDGEPTTVSAPAVHPRPSGNGTEDVKPLAVVGAAAAAGLVLAKAIDWRSHAHPRR